MCQQKIAYETLEKSGSLKGTTKAEKTMMKAQIADVEMLSSRQQEIKKETQMLGVRMENVEKDIAYLKQNMVSKQDLQNFEDKLLPAIERASKFDLVQKLFNWKVIVGILVVFLVGIIILGFGVRGLEIIAPIGNTAVGKL